MVDCILVSHRMLFLDSDGFRPQISGKLGTHSFRKGAATYCSRCGMRKDHVNLRGRWHSSCEQVDTYIDVKRPYPDAVIAGCLCGPTGFIFFDFVLYWFYYIFFRSHTLPSN